MCIYQSWSIPCSEPAPGGANRGIPGERGGQYYRGKWPVLDTLEEPTDGPRKGREMTEKALPLHLLVTSLLPFSSHHRMPWGLGKNAREG